MVSYVLVCYFLCVARFVCQGACMLCVGVVCIVLVCWFFVVLVYCVLGVGVSVYYCVGMSYFLGRLSTTAGHCPPAYRSSRRWR